MVPSPQTVETLMDQTNCSNTIMNSSNPEKLKSVIKRKKKSKVKKSTKAADCQQFYLLGIFEEFFGGTKLIDTSSYSL